MENLFKGGLIFIFFLFLFGFSACSNSSTNNNNDTTTTDTISKTSEINVNSSKSALTGSTCDRPENVRITSADYQSAGNYLLTYSWNSVSKATAYQFKLLINGTAAFQNLSVTDTFITFPQAISASDQVKASVATICGTEQSSTKESVEFVYQNAIAVDDIVLLVTPTTSVTDICNKSCDRIKFTGFSFMNSNGTPIPLYAAEMQTYYYDFNAVKTCIQCLPTGGAPIVNPAIFNSCMESPLNQVWVYDPGAYKECD